jgi:hypothetical protein
MTIFTFYDDLNLSKALYNEHESQFGCFFEVSPSRVIMGNHFATDVLFSAFITITCMLLFCKR